MYYGGGSIFNSLPIRGLADVSVFFFLDQGPYMRNTTEYG